VAHGGQASAGRHPLVNLPFVIDGGQVVAQSNACVLHLGRKFGLLGDGSPRAQSMIEQCLMQVMDLRDAAFTACSRLSTARWAPPPSLSRAPTPRRSCRRTTRSSNRGWPPTTTRAIGGGCCFLVGMQPTAPDFHLDQHSSFCPASLTHCAAVASPSSRRTRGAFGRCRGCRATVPACTRCRRTTSPRQCGG
jgi:hypothetical protein